MQKRLVIVEMFFGLTRQSLCATAQKWEPPRYATMY